MKPPLILFVLCICLSSCKQFHQKVANFAADSLFRHPATSLANLVFDRTRIDFGTVSSDTVISGKFHFRNTGKDTLLIENILPDCSCTSFDITKRVISPGDSACLTLNMSTQHKTGNVQVYSTIDANTETRLYSLEILANVK